MKFSKTYIILLLIVIIAAVLRLWNIGLVPQSPDWDEASFGYNAYSILHTGRDEYGKFLPVVIKSFGDYKPALYSYLVIPFVAIFNLTVVAIRLPSALFGILTVLTTYFLVEELFKRKDIALISAFFLAISPWHIQFSRVAFETNVGVALNVLFVLFFLKGLRKFWLLIPAGIFAALSIYTYQSEKVFVPLLVLGVVIIYRKTFFRLPKAYIFTSIALFFITLFPMLFFILTNNHALSRAESTSIFSYHPNTLQKNAQRLTDDKTSGDVLGLVFDNRRVYYGVQIFSGYISHFDIDWLFIKADLNRHHAPNMGLLYLADLPFLLTGIYLLIFDKKFTKSSKCVIFLWFLIAPIPASVTYDVPHAFRTYNFLPTFQIFTAIGIASTFFFIKEKYKKSYILYGAIFFASVVYLFNIVYYLDQYYVQQNYFYARDWQYGYSQLVPQVEGLKNNYNSVIISNKAPMDQSYIFFLFYSKYNPALYQNRVNVATDHNYEKYIFRPIDWNTDKNIPNTLLVGASTDFPKNIPVKNVILYPDNTLAMEIVSTKK